jgi:hypothetical protein
MSSQRGTVARFGCCLGAEPSQPAPQPGARVVAAEGVRQGRRELDTLAPASQRQHRP